MNLPEFSVRNSVFGNMLTVLVIVIGVLAAFTMPRELFPETDLDIVLVQTLYPNASAREVEDQVTIPIENELRGVEGIEKYLSTSTEHMSRILITIDPDADNVDRVINAISRKVDRVADLPSAAEAPQIEVVATQSTVIHILIGGEAPETLQRDFADRMKRRIEGIDGVSRVDRLGWRDAEIYVEADADKLIELDLSLLHVAEALRVQNINQPGGTLPRGTRETVLRTVGQFQTPQAIADVVVRANPDGRTIRVGDVAEVRPGFADDMLRFRVNGSRGIILSVFKKNSADLIAIADAVSAMAEQALTNLPEGLELSTIDLEAYLVRRRLNVLLGNGLVGLVLVLLALPLLLNIRVALVTALGIPFAFLSALLVMAWMHISINMMTMFGIILVLGMLVDDAIIIAENIFRYLEQGLSPKQAAIRGASEVMWPVTATVLTTVAAFAPLLFLPGIMGKFMVWIPTVVIITLLASLFEALVILPCHIADLARPLQHDRHRKGKAGRWSDALQATYERWLRHILKHRVIFLSVVLALVAGSVGLAWKTLRVDLFPAEMIDVFQVNVTMPQGTRLDATEAAVARVEAILRESLAEDELANVLSEVGHIRDAQGANVQADSRYACSWAYLTPANTRERTAPAMIEALRPAFEAVEGTERIEIQMVKPGPPVGREIEVKVVGRDLDVSNRIADEVKAFLADNGAVDVYDDFEPGKDELRLVVDKAEAARLGLDVAAVARNVYTAFDGMEATVIREAEEEIKVRVRLAEPDRSRMEALRGLRIPNRAGRMIELNKVVRFETGQGVSAINHLNGDRAVSVLGTVDRTIRRNSAAGIALAVRRQFADLHERYPGYRITFGGEAEETAKTIRALVRALGIALLLIYGILVVQFRSAIQPFTVLVSIPVGVVGVVLALVAHGKPLSMLAMLGMVGLAGVVVNDAIVLVSFINDLRQQGTPLIDAIAEGARKRVRPILLTSFTTVLGLAPVIYGIGGYEPFVAPAAIVLAYGLVFATFLTLLVVPCVYSLGADLKAAARRRMQGGGRPSAAG